MLKALKAVLLDIGHWSDGKVILQRAVVQTGFDNLAADGVQIIGKEFFDLFLHKVGEDLGAGIVALKAQLGLELWTQEGLTHILAVYRHFVQRVAKDGAAGGYQVLELHMTAAAGQVPGLSTRP